MRVHADRDWLSWLEERSEYIPETGCLEWRKSTNPQSGYGMAYFKQKDRYAALLVHRLAWTVLRGTIPKGKHLDHLCCNPPCWSPEHLEPVTPQVNVQRAWDRRRATRCPQGHEFTDDNAQRDSRGYRYCAQCSRERANAYFTGPQREEHLKRKRAYEAARYIPRPRVAPTHCPKGHSYDETNTARSKAGKLYCKRCNRERVAAWKAAQKVSA